MELSSFADGASRASSRCTVCNLDPITRGQIHAGRARDPKPVTYQVISSWLKSERKIDVNHATIRNHFTAGHHERA
jgi:hypothetical protein